MPIRFDALTLPQVQQHLARLADDAATRNRTFYAGDHWQDSTGWVGQRPPSTATGYQEVLRQIAEGFISENAIREVTNRHRQAVLGREPAWGLTVRRPTKQTPLTSDEQGLIDEAETFLTAWWDRRNLHQHLHDAVVTLLLATRATIRLYVPRGLLDDQGRVRVGSVDNALDAIFVDVPLPMVAGVFTDPDTGREYSLFADRRDGNNDYAELGFVDTAGNTVLRTIAAGGVQDWVLPLDQRLPLVELRREAFISEQVRRQQQALNLALTQMLRNVNLAGSLERTIMNAQRPGRWLNPDGSEWQEGQPTTNRRWQAEPYAVGAGVTGWLTGTPIRDAQNNLVGYANPNITYRDPVSVETFVATREQYYRGILGETQQLHALISGDALASGESRKQARSEFTDSLEPTKTAVDAAGRALLETALALAAVLAGAPNRYASLRVEFNTLVNAGPLSAEERQQTINEYTAGLIGWETAASRLGVDDVDAERQRIADDRQQQGAVDPVQALAKAFNGAD